MPIIATSRISLHISPLVRHVDCRHFSRLGLPDRLSALGLTKAFLDFDGSEEAWRRYDKITAREVRAPPTARQLLPTVLPMAT